MVAGSTHFFPEFSAFQITQNKLLQENDGSKLYYHDVQFYSK
jgi:hypothetical protein